MNIQKTFYLYWAQFIVLPQRKNTCKAWVPFVHCHSFSFCSFTHSNHISLPNDFNGSTNKMHIFPVWIINSVVFLLLENCCFIVLLLICADSSVIPSKLAGWLSSKCFQTSTGSILRQNLPVHAKLLNFQADGYHICRNMISFSIYYIAGMKHDL